MDTRPVARPHFRLVPGGASASAASRTANFTPPEVAALYDFPTQGNGAGQTIALIELGGGYTDANLAAYFKGLGISPAPHVISVSVDGGQNEPGSQADGEVQLDIEVVGSVASGAKIVVYFAPNSNQGFIDAVSQAIHDTTNAPNIVSISWGGPESEWTLDAMDTMNSVIQGAAALGVSVFIAAGDNGSSDGIDGTHIDFPGSSPSCTACSGTSLAASGTTITSEVTWNDGNGAATGGCVSDVFSPPQYQSDAGVPASPNTGKPGRGVPDIAGNADPETGYKVQIDGAPQVIGGTSAVAPLWAGLTALLNQAAGSPVGFLNPLLLPIRHRRIPKG
jgi:kumamolisin